MKTLKLLFEKLGCAARPDGRRARGRRYIHTYIYIYICTRAPRRTLAARVQPQLEWHPALDSCT
jgi:hypothetical protein